MTGHNAFQKYSRIQPTLPGYVDPFETQAEWNCSEASTRRILADIAHQMNIKYRFSELTWLKLSPFNFISFKTLTPHSLSNTVKQLQQSEGQRVCNLHDDLSHTANQSWKTPKTRLGSSPFFPRPSFLRGDVIDSQDHQLRGESLRLK